MKQLYMLIGKLLYIASYPILKLLGPRITGTRVRVQVISEKGTLLLVKTWFGSQRWSLPGGGIEKGETPEQAAVRELAEEAAIEVKADDLTLLGEMNSREGLKFHFIVYRIVVGEEVLGHLPKGRKYEIVERIWRAPEALPSDISPVVQWAIDR